MKYGIQNKPTGAQLWSLCPNGNIGAEAIFRIWGATSVIRTSVDEGLHRYMLLMPDELWYYAHLSGTSCYASIAEGFPAKNAKVASLMHEHDIAIDSLTHARATVASIEQRLADTRTGIPKL